MTIELRDDNELRVKVLKALADPVRLQIVKMLYSHREELSCGEVGEQCDVSKSNASYHFRTLREAGLIVVRKEAQMKYTSLNADTFHRFLPGFLETL